MPFKSESQRKKFHAMAGRGEISKSTVEHWEAATPKGKKLPEHVSKHANISFAAFSDELTKIADLAGMVLAQLARQKVTPPVAQAVTAAEESLAEKWHRLRDPNAPGLGY